MNNDWVFKVNWEDRYENLHEIGVLAEINEEFYLVIKSERNAKKAYEMGFKGIPGFRTDEVYNSKELFDFFQNRVLKTPGVNFCQELEKTGGTSMIDSFSVEKMQQVNAEKYKTKILETYRIQETINQVKNKKLPIMSR